MTHCSKGKANIKLVTVCGLLLIILTYFNFSAAGARNFIDASPFTLTDSPPPKKLIPDTFKGKQKIIVDSPPPQRAIADTGTIVTAQVFTKDTFNFKTSKDSLDGPVSYHADDSMVLDVPGKKMTLYGKRSNILYADNDLSAPEIQYDQRTNLVKAYLKKDSLGKVVSYVSYNQGDFKSVMDSITFDMRTQRGITKGTYTQQGEMYVYGEKIKREGPDVFYALNSRFTTCNLDTPHFAFVSKRIKFINGKMAFSGPVHPEFEGVPVPIILPFGIYPLQKGRHSGILSPNFTTNNTYGIGLENFGYYKVFNDNWDTEFRGSLFSYGGWTATLRPRYYKRYKYQGNFNLSALNPKALDQKGIRQYQVNWSHQMDNKARPGVTFNASVNAGSTQFNNQLPNSPVTNFQNNLGSTIQYSKVWKDKPYNITIAGTHTQNSVNKLVNLNLPDVLFNMNTLYPLRREQRVGELKWYENIGLGLNTRASSNTFFYDTFNIIKQAKDNFNYGVTHNVPITLTLPPIGVLQIGPSISYQENWYQKKLIQKWNNVDNKIDSSISNGFYTARDMTFGLSLNTRIFGLFAFKPSSKVMAIRHEIRPNFSIFYHPDFSGKTSKFVQTDSFGRMQKYSVFALSQVAGALPFNQSGGFNINIGNNITMKVRDRKDTSASASKKVSLLDNLSFATSYDFFRDSLRLSNFDFSANTSLFNKVNLTANASINPYRVSDSGLIINKVAFLKNPFNLGTLNNANISLQSSFRGGDKKPGLSRPNSYQNNAQISGISVDEYQRESAYIQQNPGEFADFSIPWSVDFNYSLSVNNTRILGTRRIMSTFIQSINANASVNLTPKWKIGANGTFDITNGELGLLTMYLSRDLHCWQMSINVTPAGRYRFFSINISPKSPILRDLKVNRSRSYTNF